MKRSRFAALFGDRKDVLLGIALTLLGAASVIGAGFLITWLVTVVVG